jgi:hypothetical protein
VRSTRPRKAAAPSSLGRPITHQGAIQPLQPTGAPAPAVFKERPSSSPSHSFRLYVYSISPCSLRLRVFEMHCAVLRGAHYAKPSGVKYHPTLSTLVAAPVTRASRQAALYGDSCSFLCEAHMHLSALTEALLSRDYSDRYNLPEPTSRPPIDTRSRPASYSLKPQSCWPLGQRYGTIPRV